MVLGLALRWRMNLSGEKGLSVHMLPDRVAQINGSSGGFTVRN